jgi:hypothetical protein
VRRRARSAHHVSLLLVLMDLHVAWYIACGKVPHLDAGASPQGSVGAAAVGVEGGSVADSRAALHSAAIVTPTATAVRLADGVTTLSARSDIGNAAGGCVESDLVV